MSVQKYFKHKVPFYSHLFWIRIICYRLSIILPLELEFPCVIWKNKEDYCFWCGPWTGKLASFPSQRIIKQMKRIAKCSVTSHQNGMNRLYPSALNRPFWRKGGKEMTEVHSQRQRVWKNANYWFLAYQKDVFTEVI